MIEIRQTLGYARWFAGLRDIRAKARIDIRLRRVALGNYGDLKTVGDGVSELRIDYGLGYRIYIARRDAKLIVLLCGGDKKTQDADIRRAKRLATDWKALSGENDGLGSG